MISTCSGPDELYPREKWISRSNSVKETKQIRSLSEEFVFKTITERDIGLDLVWNKMSLFFCEKYVFRWQFLHVKKFLTKHRVYFIWMTKSTLFWKFVDSLSHLVYFSNTSVRDIPKMLFRDSNERSLSDRLVIFLFSW